MGLDRKGARWVQPVNWGILELRIMDIGLRRLLTLYARKTWQVYKCFFRLYIYLIGDTHWHFNFDLLDVSRTLKDILSPSLVLGDPSSVAQFEWLFGTSGDV